MNKMFFLLEAILFGLCIGSFLNVCIHRIPQGKTLGGRSQCPRCGHKIAWYENIPLFSFLFLGGRCMYCRNKISWHYPLVELLTAALSVGTFYRLFFVVPDYFAWFLLFVCPLIVITFIDFEHRIIPDVISLPGIVAGFLVTLFRFWPDWSNALLFSFYGVLAGGGSLLMIGQLYVWIRKREGMGGGDVKLAALLGAFLGWKGVVLVFFFSSVLAVLYAVIHMMVSHSPKNEPMVIPYGPFLSAAALILFFYGNEILFWYFTLIGAKAPMIL